MMMKTMYKYLQKKPQKTFNQPTPHHCLSLCPYISLVYRNKLIQKINYT